MRALQYQVSLAAIAHFYNTGDKIRLDQISEVLSDATGAAFRVWALAALGSMVSYSRKESTFTVAKGWAQNKDELNASVLEQHPLDFVKVERDPEEYSHVNVENTLKSLIKRTSGEVGKNFYVSDEEQGILDAIRPALEAALDTIETTVQTLAPTEEDNEDTSVTQMVA